MNKAILKQKIKSLILEEENDDKLNAKFEKEIKSVSDKIYKQLANLMFTETKKIISDINTEYDYYPYRKKVFLKLYESILEEFEGYTNHIKSQVSEIKSDNSNLIKK